MASIFDGLEDVAFSASSTHGTHYPWHSRLFSSEYNGWEAGHGTAGEYLQADLNGEYDVIVVATQGRHNYPRYLTLFKLQYSLDGENFNYVVDESDTEIEFSGNEDHTTVKYNLLPNAVTARHVRLEVVAFSIDWPSARWDLFHYSDGNRKS